LGAIFVNKGLKSLVLKNIVELLFKLMFVSKNVYILFQNPDDRELFVDNNIVSENKTFLIKGSGVDVAKYTYMPDNNSRISVSLISRMLWSKGIKEFVAASIILRDSCSNVEFLLVGQPDDENPASVPSTYLENLNLLDGVRWLGRRNDVSQVMENSSIIVLPSTYGEGVPKVLIEAAAIGRPIVATDIPGCREICRHNINGLLVPPKDPVALAMAIRTLVEDRSMRGKFGKRGREIAVNEFSEEVVIEKTMAMYHELLNKHILPSKET
jgi:glycosyltransferase involved in cell wall biosynthesis